MNRLFHPLLLAALLAATALPAAARADGGVLLSGYAPPGAGEEAILGVAPPTSGSTRAPAAAAARARSTMPLAQQAVSVSRDANAPASARPRAGRRPTAAPAADADSRRARPARIADPAVIAAAAGDAPGSAFGLWQGLLAAALAATAFTLGRAWHRQDR